MADTLRSCGGAREHNLRNVIVELPRDRLIVFTGLSGSGKSSLAFDTIYAEGQRRYVESLSSYARQFLGQMDKPDVDVIEGLSPAISIDQKSACRNPRSTVGTITEVYDYLRLLYARIGEQHCPRTAPACERQTPQQIVDRILAPAEGTRFQVLAPVVRGRKGEYDTLLEDLRRPGVRARPHRRRGRRDRRVPDGEERLARYEQHTIEIVVDRLVQREGIERRLTDSLETALRLAEGVAEIEIIKPEGTGSRRERDDHVLRAPRRARSAGAATTSRRRATSRSTRRTARARRATGSARRSRSTPSSSCPTRTCRSTSGAIAPWRRRPHAVLLADARRRRREANDIDLDAPWVEAHRQAAEGAAPRRRRGKVRSSTRTATAGTASTPPTTRASSRGSSGATTGSESDWSREQYEGYMREVPCHVCNGARLKPASLAVTVNGRNISEICDLAIVDSAKFLAALELSERDRMIAERVTKEINARLGFLLDVGLDYLTLSRSAGTLAGGEAQRIRLASQIGRGLVGTLYVLDEPSIGLHQRDNRRLIDTLTRLRDLGNTVIVVEHDEETIRESDWIVDIGPGAGEHGGAIVYSGPVAGITKVNESITGSTSGREARSRSRSCAGRSPARPSRSRAPASTTCATST